jgi:two-component system cell cycle response regulator
MKCESLSERAIGRSRILLAEDNHMLACAMKSFLENIGHEVILVEDGTSVFNVVETHSPDVILLDRLMPGVDGTNICRRLKQNSDTSGIPIIMLTDRGTLSDKVVGLSAGADDYIPKPCNDEELGALICARLRTKSEWDGLKQKTRKLQETLDQVETLAHLDPLTGIFNRRRLEEVLSAEFKRATRYRLPLSCLMLDIDHFKEVNDTYGHAAGDRVLCETVKIVQKSIRDVDTAARWGGEEFIVVGPNVTKEKACVAAERIRKAVSDHSFRSIGHRSVTVSIGVAGIPDPFITNTKQLIHIADVALYDAKKDGRNRVKVAD